MSVMLRNWNNLYHKPSRRELALEPAIAALGFSYRFQHPVWGAGAFLDFYWPDLRVAVEVDGSWGHTTKADKTKDKARTARLDRLGILVVRVTNGQVDTSPTKTARAARARAEKLRESRPVQHHPVGSDPGARRPTGAARKGGKRRKGPTRKAPRRRASPGGAGEQLHHDPGQGGPGGGFPVGPALLPDVAYDPAGDAWGPVGILVRPVSPDFLPDDDSGSGSLL